METDLPCARCGYNLRGLRFDGKCPECARAVVDSLRGASLQRSDPGWLRRISHGQSLLCAGGIAAVALSVIAVVMLGHGLFMGRTGRTLESVVLILYLCCGAMMLAGVMLVTSIEPRASGTERKLSLRRIIRGLAVTITALLVATETGVRQLAWRGVRSVTIHSLLTVSIGLSLFATAALVVSLLLFLAELVDRGPAPHMARLARNRGCRFGVCAGFLLIALLTGTTMTGVLPARIVEKVWLAAELLTVGTCAYGLFILYLMISIARVLKYCREKA